MTWKTVAEMSSTEVVSEAASLASYAESCREIEQGINTKEAIRFKRCMERIEAEQLESPEYIAELHIQWDPRMAAGRGMLVSLFRNGCTLEGMRKLFS
jgi:hypothetical protein